MVWEYLQTLMPRMGLILSTPLYKQMAIRVEVFNILVYMILCFSRSICFIYFSVYRFFQVLHGVTTLPAQTTHWILKGKSFKSTIHIPCLTPPRWIIHWPRLTPIFQGVYSLQLIQVNLEVNADSHADALHACDLSFGPSCFHWLNRVEDAWCSEKTT